jgi:hypothetical protein
VVTNLSDGPEHLYNPIHCQRGEVEHRIKQAQVGLFAARTSCHHFATNQLGVLLAALAYGLIERLRALALQGAGLASAQIDTRRIRLYLASN